MNDKHETKIGQQIKKKKSIVKIWSAFTESWNILYV